MLGRHQKLKQFREEVDNSSCSNDTPQNDYTQPLLHAKFPGEQILQKMHAENSNFAPRICNIVGATSKFFIGKGPFHNEFGTQAVCGTEVTLQASERKAILISPPVATQRKRSCMRDDLLAPV